MFWIVSLSQRSASGSEGWPGTCAHWHVRTSLARAHIGTCRAECAGGVVNSTKGHGRLKPSFNSSLFLVSLCCFYGDFSGLFFAPSQTAVRRSSPDRVEINPVRSLSRDVVIIVIADWVLTERRSLWLGPGGTDVPGPGEYNIAQWDRSSWVKPAPVFGKELQRPLQLFVEEAEASLKPGPGEYNPRVPWDAGGAIFGRSVRNLFEEEMREAKQHPAPGDYEVSGTSLAWWRGARSEWYAPRTTAENLTCMDTAGC